MHTKEDIFKIATRSPHVCAALQLWLHDKCTYEQAMIEAVVALSQAYETVRHSHIELLLRTPYNREGHHGS